MKDRSILSKQPVSSLNSEQEQSQEGKSLNPPAFQLKASESPSDEPWIPEVGPDGHVVLKAEEGDNWSTLMQYFANSELAPAQMANLRAAFAAANGGDSSQQGIIGSSSIDLTQGLGGPFAEMSRLLNVTMIGENNCAGTAIPIAKGSPVDIHEGIDPSHDADEILRRDFESIPLGKAIVGQTVIRNATTKGADTEAGQTNRPLHYSTFLGMDQAGNIYVFTKNGYQERWDIQMLGQFHVPGNPESTHPNFGTPMPISDSTSKHSSGFYNLK